MGALSNYLHSCNPKVVYYLLDIIFDVLKKKKILSRKAKASVWRGRKHITNNKANKLHFCTNIYAILSRALFDFRYLLSRFLTKGEFVSNEYSYYKR